MPPATTSTPITLVVAGSFDQFLSWCDENQLHARNPRVKYVRFGEDLRGYHPPGARLVKYGTWYKRDRTFLDHVQAFELEELLHSQTAE